MGFQVLVGQGASSLASDDQQFLYAVRAGQLAPDVPVSVDAGRTWIRADVLFARLHERGDDGAAMFVPMRVETYSTLGQYLGLFSLLFFGGPICVIPVAMAFDPGTTSILLRLGFWLGAMVLGPLPIAALGLLGLRALRRDPTQRGKGRAIFALVVAGIMAAPMLVALPFLLFR